MAAKDIPPQADKNKEMRERVEFNELRARDAEARLKIVEAEIRMVELRPRLAQMKGGEAK
jgi:hypothetical protein